MTAGRTTGAATDKTILFGGSGFLGSHILKERPDIISVGRTRPLAANRHIPIASLQHLDALDDVDFDSVIFAVGSSDHHTMERETPDSAKPTPFECHVAPLLQVLEQLKGYPIRKFIHFSTVLIYDWQRAELPVAESDATNPYASRYVLSKHMAEEACRFYSSRIPVINVRLSNMYGPTRSPRYDIINNLIVQLLATKKGSVWTTRPKRDFIYVEDAARAVIKLMESDYAGTINLGSGESTSIATVVDLLREISGFPIADGGCDVTGPQEFRCDISLLKSLVDWSPQVPIEQGVRRTYDVMAEWFRS